MGFCKTKRRKVSIIIPTYNAKKTIETSIFTLIGQTWSNLEIIVVDDLSSDNTVDIVESIAKRDTRVKLIRQQENSGPYVARNKACEIATGEFITVADADDWHHPQKIELQAEILVSKDIVANVACWIRATSDLTTIRRGNPYYRHLNISSLMIRKSEVLSKLGAWDSVRFGGDSEFFKRLICVFGKDRVFELNAVTSIGRVYSDSLTNCEAFGYNGYPFGARREYLENYEFFHSKSRKGGFKYDGGHAPYPLPMVMYPSYKKDALRVNKVFLGDFRREEDADAGIDFAASCESKGLSYALVHIYSYSVDPRLRVYSKLRRFLHKNNKTLNVYGEHILADEAVIYDASIFKKKQNYLPKVSVNNVVAIDRNGLSTTHIRQNCDEIISHIKDWLSGDIEFFVYNNAIKNANHELGSVIKIDQNVYKEDIFNSDVTNIDKFEYCGSKKIAIVMPCIDRELGHKTAEIMIQRAGVDCTVIIAFDSIRQGFIKTINSVSQKGTILDLFAMWRRMRFLEEIG